jgi:hypothetical protein
MSILQNAIDTLVSAEAAMKRLIAEAAEHGDYSLVEKLAKWAGSLGGMYTEEQSAAQSNRQPSVPSGNEATTPPVAVATKRKASTKKPGHSKRRAYPVFAKSGDSLVKIAWSKSSKSEYHHKSPRFVAKVLADSLIRQDKESAIVSMDKILPLKTDDGSEIPDYQVYVSLAWLRKVGAVKQNGRQGYTVKKTNDLQAVIDNAWSNLPEATFG